MNGVIGIPCCVCGEFNAVMNRAAYRRATDRDLVHVCRDCRALSDAERDAEVRLPNALAIRAAIAHEYRERRLEARAQVQSAQFGKLVLLERLRGMR